MQRRRSARRARSTVLRILVAPLVLAARGPAGLVQSRTVMPAPLAAAVRRTGWPRQDLRRRAPGGRARVGLPTGNVLPPDRADPGDIDRPRIGPGVGGADATVSLKMAWPPAPMNMI